MSMKIEDKEEEYVNFISETSYRWNVITTEINKHFEIEYFTIFQWHSKGGARNNTTIKKNRNNSNEKDDNWTRRKKK